jgi:hypothetical protein
MSARKDLSRIASREISSVSKILALFLLAHEMVSAMLFLPDTESMNSTAYEPVVVSENIL